MWHLKTCITRILFYRTLDLVHRQISILQVSVIEYNIYTSRHDTLFNCSIAMMVNRMLVPPRLIESTSDHPSGNVTSLQPNTDRIVYKGHDYDSATQALNDYIREYDGTRMKNISKDVFEVH